MVGSLTGAVASQSVKRLDFDPLQCLGSQDLIKVFTLQVLNGLKYPFFLETAENSSNKLFFILGLDSVKKQTVYPIGIFQGIFHRLSLSLVSKNKT